MSSGNRQARRPGKGKGRTTGWKTKRESRFDFFLEECYAGRKGYLYLIQHGTHHPEADKTPSGERGPPLRRIPNRMPLAPSDQGEWGWVGRVPAVPSGYKYRSRIQSKRGKDQHRMARAVKLVRDYYQQGEERTSNAAGVLRMIMNGVQVWELRTQGQMWNARTLSRAIRYLSEEQRDQARREEGPVGVAAAGPEGVPEDPADASGSAAAAAPHTRRRLDSGEWSGGTWGSWQRWEGWWGGGWSAREGRSGWRW